MAKANPRTRTPKRARTLTVSTLHSHIREDKERQCDVFVRVPHIRISGAWLHAAGFYSNNQVRVELKRRGRMVLTLI